MHVFYKKYKHISLHLAFIFTNIIFFFEKFLFVSVSKLSK